VLLSYERSRTSAGWRAPIYGTVAALIWPVGDASILMLLAIL
jgi:hypothetical protein